VATSLLRVHQRLLVVDRQILNPNSCTSSWTTRPCRRLKRQPRGLHRRGFSNVGAVLPPFCPASSWDMSEASSIQSSPKAAVSQPQPRIPSKSEPQLALQSVTSSLAPGHLHPGGLQTDRSPSAESLQSEVRRSASIPQIRGIHPKKTGTISSPTDKRRNKLGYQRSSMACGELIQAHDTMSVSY